MKRILLPVLSITLLLSTNFLAAQVLVNKVWQDTTGNPQDTLTLPLTVRDGSSNIVTVGNTYAASDSEQLLITKYTNAGSKVWQVKIASPSTKRLIATDLDISNGYIYIASSPFDSTNSKSTFVTYKLSDATGSTVWSKQYTPSYAGYAVPAAVREDSLGNVYVAGTEQTASAEYEMTVLKYNSSGTVLWTSHYDTTGLYTGAVGMGSISLKDSAVVVTGYSGSTFGTWDILTTTFNSITGVLRTKSRVSNGSGGFISHPVALAKDGKDNIYVVGASEISGPNVDIKLIKYDSLFNQVWVKTWGGKDSLDDEPLYMVQDAANNLIITGYTTRASGERDLLVVKYDKNGNVLWSRSINNSSPSSLLSATGNGVAVDTSNNIYVAGQIYNGRNYDFITLAFNSNGITLWEKIYDGGGTDIGYNIVADTTGNIFASGTTADTTRKFITMMFSQLPYTPTVVQSTAGIPRHATNEVIVRFKKASVINPSFFAKTDGQYSTLGTVIDSADVAQMDVACNAGGTMKNWRVEKVFTSLTSSDTLSQTRHGDTLRVPNFWSTLLLHTQKTLSSGDNAEIAVVDSLKKLSTKLVYSQLNYIGHFDSSPNDYYYSVYQTSLHYNSGSTYSTPYGHIRAEPAWNFTTGRSFVKVGIFDSGLDYTNPDFGYQATDMDDKCKNGYDFSNSASLFAEPSADSVGHGTACAGIIGAVSNNSIGVAGIAGGWYIAGNTASNNANGVSLYGAKLTSNIYNEDTLIFLSHAANAIVTTAYFNANDLQNAYGLNVMNNSWGIDSVETPGYYYSSNEFLLRDAVHTANRLQVIFVASRGNTSTLSSTTSYTHLPACYDSSWVLNVGGADEYGDYSTGSLQGGNVDIIAPSYPGNIYTTSSIDPAYPTILYVGFGGTSGAAAHASGVASLLLSYVNDTVADYSNLTQEDVEFLIEKSARDVTPSAQSGTAIGYDTLTGYGFLLADSALGLIQKPNYYIKHFGNSHGISSTFTDSLISSNTTLQFNESTTGSNQYNFAPFTNYKCNVYKVKAHVNHSLGGTEQIKYAWARHSGSNTANLYSSSTIWPHERVIINDYTTGYADLSNFVYQVMDTAGNFLGWYPSDTTTAHTKLEYSLLIYNPALTEVQKVEEETGSILVFPNPSKNTQTIEINLDKSEHVAVTLYDVQGRLIGEVYNGVCAEGRTDIPSNISRLASGIYIYRIQAQSFAQSVKFNKQ